MRYLLALSLLYSAAQSGSGLPFGPQKESAGPARIVVVGEEAGEVVAEPLIPPRFGFRLEAGEAPERGVLECRQRTEQRTAGDVQYPVLILDCAGQRRLVLTSVDLTQ